MNRAIMLMVLLCLAPTSLQAGIPEAPKFQIFGTDDGLPSNEIDSMVMDQAGYLWLATTDGLARYDGFAFTSFSPMSRMENSPPVGRVTKLAIDSNDQLWFIDAADNLGSLSPDRKTFRYYKTATENWIRGGSIGWITQGPHGIWFLTEEGLYQISENEGKRMDLPQWLTSSPQAILLCMKFDESGVLWIGTTKGLATWDGKRFENKNLSEFKNWDASGPSGVWSIVPAKGGVYVDTSQGLYWIDRDGGISGPLWPKIFSSGNPLLGTLADSRGRWLIAAKNIWRMRASVLTQISLPPERFSIGSRPQILAAHDGTLFFSLPQGLGRLPPMWHSTAYLSSARNLIRGEQHYAIAPSDTGGFWVAGLDGLIERLDKEGKASTAPARILKLAGKRKIFSILEAKDGSIWFAGSNLHRARPNGQLVSQWTPRDSHDPVLGGAILKLVEGRRGEIWSITYGTGLEHRDADGRILHQLRDVALADIQSSPSGDVWLAASTGPEYWDSAEGKFVRVQGIEGGVIKGLRFIDDDHAVILRVKTIELHERTGKMWKLKASKNLAHGQLAGLQAAPDGKVWFTTNRGLFLWHPKRNEIETIGANEGMFAREFIQGSLSLDKHGVLAAATLDGTIVLYDTLANRVPPVRSNLVIDSMELRRDGQWVNMGSPRTMLPDDQEMRVRFRLLAYRNPVGNTYRTKLEGFDNDWVKHTGADPGERVFANLPAGQYVLRARASDGEGTEAAERVVQFVVLPVWWQSRPALLAYFGLFLLASWGAALLYRRRLARQTALRQVQHEREVAREASLAKTRFLATLGHEVRTPMTGVLGMSELMLGTPLDATQRGYMTAIHGAGEHLVRLVNDALDLSRIESGKLELLEAPFDLVKLIDEIAALLKPLAQSKGLSFEVRIDDGVRAGQLGDSSRVRQILLNLLGNAIKFTEAGRVWLDVTQPDEDCVRFEVGDTGPGLNEEQKSRLFRRFEQAEGAHTAARYGGSGLGLAICQELAALMQGTIAVDSTPGHGARFVFDLQLHAAVLPETLEPQSPLATTPSRAVLLVEDDSIVADVIVGLLQAQGHRVTHVAHGLAAMSEATLCTFDLALLDLDLPGIDGFALARHLRAQGFDAPMVAVTARADAQVQEMALQAGCARFLRKPLSGAMLAQLIAELEQLRTQPA